MRDKDDEADVDLDDFDRAARINFRDYPSSAAVVIAALGSGLAWALYRWLGRKRTAPESVSEAEGPVPLPQHSGGAGSEGASPGQS